MKKTVVLPLLGLLFLTQTAEAKIKLPDLLGSNMVLQQQSNVNLWGEATPDKTVKIRTGWDKNKYSVKADKDGKWQVKIKTPQAGGPYDISISDGEEIILDNVLIGEVWLCSGQSNMEMPVKGYPSTPVNGSINLITEALPSQPIRLFTVSKKFSKTPQDHCSGNWKLNDSENVADFSATAYYFGRSLQQKLGVPIGLISSNWGGANIETWMSRESLAAFPEVPADIADKDRKGNPVLHPHRQPANLFNAMISPLKNYTIKGTIWYQGETNRNKPEEYKRLFPAMVKDWRTIWEQGDFPFYYVQIAPYDYEDSDIAAARFREMQEECQQIIPNSGMVCTLDIGEANEIHPAEKEKVGKRLAYWALSKDYGINGLNYTAPKFESMAVQDDGKVLLIFNGAELGLSPQFKELSGFEIAGADRVFHPAKAKIVTYKYTQVLVWCDEVPQPVAVRYGYKSFVTGELRNNLGLPVSTFRTDDW